MFFLFVFFLSIFQFFALLSNFQGLLTKPGKTHAFFTSPCHETLGEWSCKFLDFSGCFVVGHVMLCRSSVDHVYLVPVMYSSVSILRKDDSALMVCDRSLTFAWSSLPITENFQAVVYCSVLFRTENNSHPQDCFFWGACPWRWHGSFVCVTYWLRRQRWRLQNCEELCGVMWRRNVAFCRQTSYL